MASTQRSAIRTLNAPVNFFTSHGVYRNPEIDACEAHWDRPPCDQNESIMLDGPCEEPTAKAGKKVCDEPRGQAQSLPFDIYRGEVVGKCTTPQNIQQALADRMSMSLAKAIYSRDNENDPTPTLMGCAEDISTGGKCVCPELALGLLAAQRSLKGNPGGQFVVPMEVLGLFTNTNQVYLDGRGYRGPGAWPVLVDAGIPVNAPGDPAGTARIFVTGAIEWNVDNLGGEQINTVESWEAEILQNIKGTLQEARARVDMDDCGVYSICVTIACSCTTGAAE